MSRPVVHTLRTPTGRCCQISIRSDGTRVFAAHFHKRELTSIAVALDAAKERAMDKGDAADARHYEQLRDLFFGAMDHDASHPVL